jgi:DNA-3-methyladenine glycosylase II
MMNAVNRRDTPWRVPTPLTDASLARAAQLLAKKNQCFKHVLQKHGVPPLWAREPGFATLLHIILEQQVSLASARAAFNKLQSVLGEITPSTFLTLDDAQLKAIGFSRQKTRYGRKLAQAVLGGTLDLHALHALPDDAVKMQLMAVKGIGQWTTDIYLLMALRRPDVIPKGDLALLIAAQRLFALPARPTPLELEALAEAWRPHRATAARILWHFYLSERK